MVQKHKLAGRGDVGKETSGGFSEEVTPDLRFQGWKGIFVRCSTSGEGIGWGRTMDIPSKENNMQSNEVVEIMESSKNRTSSLRSMTRGQIIT